MGIWDLYQSRINTKGNTKRDAAFRREVRMFNNKFPDSLSYHSVTIDEVERQVEIIDTDNLNIKYIHSFPGEDIDCGALVYWMGYYWLVTERDANSEINTRAKMRQCNYLLKWVNDKNEICKQWCIVEDGTKLKYIVYGAIYNSLAHWKRCAKRTPLIAGNPLEPYKLQHRYETRPSVKVKNYKDWAISR